MVSSASSGGGAWPGTTGTSSTTIAARSKRRTCGVSGIVGPASSTRKRSDATMGSISATPRQLCSRSDDQPTLGRAGEMCARQSTDDRSEKMWRGSQLMDGSRTRGPPRGRALHGDASAAEGSVEPELDVVAQREGRVGHAVLAEPQALERVHADVAVAE